MQIQVKAFPSSRKNSIKQESGVYKVYITAPAVDDKANEAVIEILADFFDVRPRFVTIVKGLKSRLKVINIEGL